MVYLSIGGEAMEDFLEFIDAEIFLQRILAKKSKQTLKRCPEGSLCSKQRKGKTAFYHQKRVEGGVRQSNISNQKDLIKALLDKRVSEVTLTAAEKNIRAMQKLKEQYQPNAFTDIIRELSKSYRDAVAALGSAQTLDEEGRPIQYHFDPEKHIHETNCGLMVRSKSEVIITNTLTGYGIPFSYEKDFPRYEGDEWPLQPDFTFDLPNGEVKLWEHLGMLTKEKYCKHNADKLYWYQKLGFHIGRNLIITQDDAKGNCSSPYIDKMIRGHLLPYYRR